MGLPGVRVMLLLCAAVTACTSPSPETCGGTRCGDTQRCVAGECRNTCTATLDCARAQVCEGGVCTPGMVVASSSGAGQSSQGTASGSSSTSGGWVLSGGTSMASSFSPATSAATASSSGSSSAGTSSAPGSSAASMGGTSSSGAVDCTSLDTACFVGAAGSSGGCVQQYRCPYGQVCVTPGNTCVAYPAPAVPGTDPVAGECYILHPNARTFLVCNLLGSWQDARAWCQMFGGFDLLQMGDVSEQQALGALLNGGRGWMGLSDATTEGSYSWSNAAAFGYGAALGSMPWCAGAPDNAGGNEDCVEFVAGTGTDCWNDADCASTSRAVMCSR